MWIRESARWGEGSWRVSGRSHGSEQVPRRSADPLAPAPVDGAWSPDRWYPSFHGCCRDSCTRASIDGVPSGLVWRVLALFIACVGGCTASRHDDVCAVTAYAIQVEVAVPFDVGTQGVVVRWADQEMSAGIRAPERYSIVQLRRVFSTRDEALAFDTPFVVNVAGVDRGRAAVDFADCDQVAAIGQDPAERHQAVFSFSLDFSGDLEGGGAYAGLACRASSDLPTPEQLLEEGCEPSGRTLIYRVRLDGEVLPTSVLVDGVAVPPAAIWPSTQGVYFEIGLRSALDHPVRDVIHSVVIEQDGVRSSPHEARFEPCIAEAMREDIDPDTLLYQRQALEVVDGVLQIDSWAGYECGTVDGWAFGATP